MIITLAPETEMRLLELEHVVWDNQDVDALANALLTACRMMRPRKRRCLSGSCWRM